MDPGAQLAPVATLPPASLREMRNAADADAACRPGRTGTTLPRVAIHPKPMRARPPSPLIPLEAIPSRRFDDWSLARIAQAPTTAYCDCPRHVVEVLPSLGIFERCSAECADRSPQVRRAI